MKRLGRFVAVMLLCSVVTAGAAGAVVVQKQRKVSAEKYARTVCVALVRAKQAREDFIDAYNEQQPPDNAALQQQAIALADELVGELSTVRTRLKKSYPDIDDGKDVAKLFVANIAQQAKVVQEARDGLADADPNSAAFTADIVQFEVGINILDTKVDDPFSEVKDSDLLAAFDEEPRCDNVVTVFGA